VRRPASLLAALLLGWAALHLLATETPVVDARTGWQVEGHFAPGGIFPISDESTLARSPVFEASTPLWGSFAGDERHTGLLRSPSFEAPRFLGLFVTGYPRSTGISLFLERNSDGLRYPLRVASPGPIWRDARFALPRGFRGEDVRLVAIDEAKQQDGWLGLAMPRALSSGAWLVGWMRDRSPISPGRGFALLLLASASHLGATRWLTAQQRQGFNRSSLAAMRLGAPVLLTSLFLVHYGVIYRYAVDVPFMAEWQHLSAGLAREFSGDWIWARTAGEQIPFTKLHTWLLYLTGGWNLRSQILQNFALYGATLAATFRFACRCAPQTSRWVWLAFLAPMLSPIAHENHQWGIQSQLHFTLLFLLLCARLAFFRHDLASGAAAGALGLAATLSGATGAASVAGLVVVFVAYSLSPASERALRRQRYARLALVALPCAAAIAAGAGGYANGSSTSPAHVAPYALHYLNLISGGFGVSSDSWLLGGLWLAVSVIPLALGFVFAFARGGLNSQLWGALGLSVAVLAGLAATSLSHAHLGAEEAKASRYSELAFLLLPLSAIAWSVLLSEAPVWRRRALVTICTLAAFASLDDWNTRPYRLQKIAREGGVACARHYYETDSRGVCPTIADEPIPLELTRARDLELHFYRALNLKRATESLR
jgi:hypothetical protein